jgi:hypothetical protein
MGIRVGYMSDLHLEFEWRREFVGDAEWRALRDARDAEPGHPGIGPWLGDVKGRVDLMAVPGDTAPGTAGVRYLADVADYLGVPVLSVLGNHEFYGHEMAPLKTVIAAEAAAVGVDVLDDAAVEHVVGGRRVRVVGATLWTDFRLGAPGVPQAAAMDAARRGMNDFENIYTGARAAFAPEDAAALHARSLVAIADAVAAARAAGAAALVLTHHAPLRAAAPTGARAALAPAYASDLVDALSAMAPDAWLFGHVHETFSARVGRTFVGCACRGYVGRGTGWGFRPSVVEIP